MRIAIPYEDGNVFQHFGKSSSFGIYETDGEKVLSAQIVPARGEGHDALAGFLARLGVNTVICGGIGEGARSALAEAGIEVVAGVSGCTDQVAADYLKGLIEGTEAATCAHHAGGCHGEGGCGGDCGSEGGCGGCGGCHGGAPAFEGKNVGKTCRVHYRGTLNDGTQFDSSYDRGEPLEFICGAGMMIEGFDRAVADLEAGDSVDIHLMPEEAYGMPDPAAILTVEIAGMPGAEALTVGQRVYLSGIMGQPVPVTVTAMENGMITFDANHEMAGRELNFHIEMLEID